jgi:trimeric autotransporter adhesin
MSTAIIQKNLTSGSRGHSQLTSPIPLSSAQSKSQSSSSSSSTTIRDDLVSSSTSSLSSSSSSSSSSTTCTSSSGIATTSAITKAATSCSDQPLELASKANSDTGICLDPITASTEAATSLEKNGLDVTITSTSTPSPTFYMGAVSLAEAEIDDDVLLAATAASSCPPPLPIMPPMVKQFSESLPDNNTADERPIEQQNLSAADDVEFVDNDNEYAQLEGEQQPTVNQSANNNKQQQVIKTMISKSGVDLLSSSSSCSSNSSTSLSSSTSSSMSSSRPVSALATTTSQAPSSSQSNMTATTVNLNAPVMPQLNGADKEEIVLGEKNNLVSLLKASLFGSAIISPLPTSSSSCSNSSSSSSCSSANACTPATIKTTIAAFSFNNQTNSTSGSVTCVASSATSQQQPRVLLPEERISSETKEFWATLDLYNNSKMAFNKRCKSVKLKREKLNLELQKRQQQKQQEKPVQAEEGPVEQLSNNNHTQPLKLQNLEICTCVKCAIIYHEALIKGITDVNAIICNKCNYKLIYCKCCSGSSTSSSSSSTSNMSAQHLHSQQTPSTSITSTLSSADSCSVKSTLSSDSSEQATVKRHVKDEFNQFEEKLLSIKNELVRKLIFLFFSFIFLK